MCRHCLERADLNAVKACVRMTGTEALVPEGLSYRNESSKILAAEKFPGTLYFT